VCRNESSHAGGGAADGQADGGGVDAEAAGVERLEQRAGCVRRVDPAPQFPAARPYEGRCRTVHRRRHRGDGGLESFDRVGGEGVRDDRHVRHPGEVVAAEFGGQLRRTDLLAGEHIRDQLVSAGVAASADSVELLLIHRHRQLDRCGEPARSLGPEPDQQGGVVQVAGRAGHHAHREIPRRGLCGLIDHQQYRQIEMVAGQLHREPVCGGYEFGDAVVVGAHLAEERPPMLLDRLDDRGPHIVGQAPGPGADHFGGAMDERGDLGRILLRGGEFGEPLD